MIGGGRTSEYCSRSICDDVTTVHKFKVGQTVDLIPSTFRSAAKGRL